MNKIKLIELLTNQSHAILGEKFIKLLPFLVVIASCASTDNPADKKTSEEQAITNKVIEKNLIQPATSDRLREENVGNTSANPALNKKLSADKEIATEKQLNPTIKKAPETVILPSNHSNTEAKKSKIIQHKYKYKVRGKRYKVFANANSFQEVGVASWYGPGFHGKKTANGEIYNMHAMTAAHKTLPLGSKVRVTNLSNGRKITVRINDRGPFHDGRVIDLSKKAAQQLGIIKYGAMKVHIRALH